MSLKYSYSRNGQYLFTSITVAGLFWGWRIDTEVFHHKPQFSQNLSVTNIRMTKKITLQPDILKSVILRQLSQCLRLTTNVMTARISCCYTTIIQPVTCPFRVIIYVHHWSTVSIGKTNAISLVNTIRWGRFWTFSRLHYNFSKTLVLQSLLMFTFTFTLQVIRTVSHQYCVETMYLLKMVRSQFR